MFLYLSISHIIRKLKNKMNSSIKLLPLLTPLLIAIIGRNDKYDYSLLEYCTMMGEFL